MLTLLGSALGFITGLAPAVFKFIERRQDNAQELAMMDKQTESNKAVAGSQLQATIADGQLKSIIQSMKENTRVTVKASPWVINVVALVRPIVTYAFFALFAYLEVAVVVDWITPAQFATVWGEETKAIFATIISHWFGHRTSKHLMGKA